jgi:1-acyl-sn-glycerol-3-phosphate acyltransferase
LIFSRDRDIHPLEPFGVGNRLFFGAGRVVAALVLRVYHGFTTSGPQPPDEGPFIIAANHESFLDPVVLQYAVRRRRLHYMMSALFYHTRLLNYFSSAMRAIPVEEGGPNRRSIRLALEVLEAGRPVAIFPQGGRMDAGDLSGGFKGVAFLIRKAGVPVVPARIAGTGKALPRGARFPRPARIGVRLGEPLDFAAGTDLDEITSAIMSAIRDL